MRRRDALRSLGGFALAGCVRRDDGGAGRPLELLIGAEPQTLDPRFVADVYGLRIARLVHAPLFRPHPDTLEPEPLLAEHPRVDESGILTFSVRENACFDDGKPVVAGDVIATLEALGDATLGAPAKRLVDTLARIEAPDGLVGRTVRLHPRAPRATLLGDLDLAVLSADHARRPRGAALASTGPYRLTSVEPGVIALSPSATFGRWATPSARRAVVVRTVRDEAARAMRMLGSAADLAPGSLSPANAKALVESADGQHLTLVRRDGATTAWLTLHCGRAPLDRPEARRALAMAIDVETLVATKLDGQALVARGLLPPMLGVAAPPRDPFDPRAAAALWAAHGAQRPLELLTSPDRLRVSVARAIAQMLTDVGVVVELRIFELGTLFARLAGGEFDLAPTVSGEIDDPETLRWYIHSGATPPRGQNRGRFADAEVDALLDRGVSELMRERRLDTYAALERRLAALRPMLPLWHEAHIAVVGPRARGFRPGADGRWGALATLG
jgi:peptide/nickel transport system substrate-binding protein